MRRIASVLLLATLSLWASFVHAAPFHYDVDWQTAGGSIWLSADSSASFNSGQWTFNAKAHNLGSQTYHDVLFLFQFIYDSSLGFTFNDTTKVWSFDGLGAPNWMSFPDLTNYYSMTDTNAPLSWTVTSPTSRSATMLATDNVPYVSIGDILPDQTIPFTFVADVNTRFVPFNLVASFVSLTPLPEPSGLALSLSVLGLGGLGTFVLRRTKGR